MIWADTKYLFIYTHIKEKFKVGGINSNKLTNYKSCLYYCRETRGETPTTIGIPTLFPLVEAVVVLFQFQYQACSRKQRSKARIC